jgi:hypothetical protein
MLARSLFHASLVAALALTSGCASMARPRGGHFVAHGFYHAHGDYRVRAASRTPETALVPEPWQLVGFGEAAEGVPGHETERGLFRRYDFRYEHTELGEIWARRAYLPFDGVRTLLGATIPDVAGAATNARFAHRVVSYGPATIDGELGWMITFDLWIHTPDGAATEVRATVASVQPPAEKRRRYPSLVIFGFASTIARHAEGLRDFESMLSRVDFRREDGDDDEDDEPEPPEDARASLTFPSSL